MEIKIKRTIAILLAVCFLISLTATAGSAMFKFDKKQEILKGTKDINPTHKYAKAGKYTVSLTVKNAAGSTIKEVSNYITVK